jgi:hypothetical protein
MERQVETLLRGLGLSLWRDADPDIPIYKQAKVEYSRLL